MLAIYIRISKKKKEGEDTSMSTQEKLGIELATQLKVGFEKYVDDGISGTKGVIGERPEFARMLQDIDRGKISGVYIQYQDRLERNLDVWNLFKTIILKNNCDYYPSGRKTDLTDPQAVFTAQVMSASNALYAALTGARVSESIRRRAEEGKFRGLKAYGYRQNSDGKLEVNPTEAEYVRRMFRESVSGIGVWKIAVDLNEDKIPTRFNGMEGVTRRKDPFTGSITEHDKKKVRWRGNVVHDIIRNPIYKGEKWIKGVMYNAPVIIEQKEWDRVNKNLEANKKKVGKKTYYNYLLNDLIVCASCDRKFVGKKRMSSFDNSYKCKGKIYPNPDCSDARGININKLDSFILKHLFVDKTLKDMLLSVPQDDSLVKLLEKKLKSTRRLLKRKKEEVSLTRQRLLDPDFTNDPEIKLVYSKRKKELEALEQKVNREEKRKDDAGPVVIKRRTDNLLSQYVEGLEFKEVKRIVHGLIDWIKILHHKEEGKIGNFLIDIKYRGYDEVSSFMTNWTATKWYWIRRYRGKAITEEDLRADEDFKEYLTEEHNIPKSKEERKQKILMNTELSVEKQQELLGLLDIQFEGFETVHSMNQIIELSEEDIVYFN